MAAVYEKPKAFITRVRASTRVGGLPVSHHRAGRAKRAADVNTVLCGGAQALGGGVSGAVRRESAASALLRGQLLLSPLSDVVASAWAASVGMHDAMALQHGWATGVAPSRSCECDGFVWSPW